MVAALLLGACGSPEEEPNATDVVADGETAFPATAGVHELSVEAGGLTRWLLLAIPEGYDGSTPVPLILVFHGGGGAARRMLEDRGDLLDLGRQRTFLTALLQGYNRTSTRSGSATWNAAHYCGAA